MNTNVSRALNCFCPEIVVVDVPSVFVVVCCDRKKKKIYTGIVDLKNTRTPTYSNEMRLSVYVQGSVCLLVYGIILIVTFMLR